MLHRAADWLSKASAAAEAFWKTGAVAMHAGTEGTALKTRAVHGLVRNPIFIYFLDRQKKKKSFQLALVFSQPTYVLLKYKLPTGSSFCSPCRPKLFNWLYLYANLQDSVHLSAAKSLQINLKGKK